MRIALASLQVQTDAALSVSDINRHIKAVLDNDPILEDVAVTGEISNFKAHSSGHLYFSLKDENASIECRLWRSQVSKLRFRPSNGDRVIVYGRVEFYAAQGRVNFIVQNLHFAGQGAQHEAFEKLKVALAEDGLFDEARKKKLPARPRRIGLITSGTGAAPHDVLSVLKRRWPLGEVVLIPTLVQGFDAPADIIRALSWAEALDDLEVVIVARGGGSAEDLWCFNDETLCRYAADFPIPLISAVGHEVDFTLFDFISDLRAATPTAAAEIVAPDIRELLGEIYDLRKRLRNSVATRVLLARTKLDYLQRNRVLTHPHERFQREREKLNSLTQRLREAPDCRIQIEKQKLENRRFQLRALDPQRVLERGYAILQNADAGVLTSSRDAQIGQTLTAQLHDGTLQVRVETTS